MNTSAFSYSFCADTICQASGSPSHPHGPYTAKCHHSFPMRDVPLRCSLPSTSLVTRDACLLESSHMYQNRFPNKKKTLTLSQPGPCASLLVFLLPHKSHPTSEQQQKDCRVDYEVCFHNYWNCTHTYTAIWLFTSSTPQWNALSMGQNAISLP